MQLTDNMKKITAFVLIVLLGCTIYLYFNISNLPIRFLPNSFPWSINKDYKNLIDEFEFAIAYEQDEGTAGWNGYKIIALKDNEWYKITIKPVDIFKPSDSQSGLQIIQAKWDHNLATTFLDSLQQYHLFTLPSQKKLIEQCDSFTNVIDGGGFTIEIISDWKVRRQYYFMPYTQYENCPDVREWYYVDRIQNLFQQKWQ